MLLNIARNSFEIGQQKPQRSVDEFEVWNRNHSREDFKKERVSMLSVVNCWHDEAIRKAEKIKYAVRMLNRIRR